jgi:hypothetical protein
MEGTKKKILRFTTLDDIVLLKEVLAVNPFEDKGRWLQIATNASTTCEKEICARRAKERTTINRKLQLKETTLKGN